MHTDSLLLGALRSVGRAVLWLLDALLTIWPWNLPGDDSYRARRRRRIAAALTLVTVVGTVVLLVPSPDLV